MLKIANISIIALVAGVAIHVLLGLSLHTSFGSHNFFISCIATIVAALTTILPGFVTGLVSGERGLLHGVFLALGIFLYVVVTAFLFKSGGSIGHAIDQGLHFLSVTAVAQCIVTALAGVAVRKHGLFY